MPVWVSTTESEMGLFTTDCTNSECNVPYKYSMDVSNSEEIVMQEYGSDTTDIFNGQSLIYTKFTGKIVKDTVRIQYDEIYSQETRTIFLAIEDTTKFISSDYSGYVGLGPYSADSDNKSFNFLYQLKKNGYIDYMAFSLYTREDINGTKSSTIKFGGYDEKGLAANERLTVLRTINEKSWALEGQHIVIGGRLLRTTGSYRNTIIEP